jgi:hypothetical protein
MLTDHRVEVLTFRPHTTHIFQRLDLSVFGNLKKIMNYRLPLGSDGTMTRFIKRIFHIMNQRPVEDNVRSSFVQLGLTYDIDTIPYVLRQSPGFTSLWERDYPVEKLSQRGRNVTFGSIHKMRRPNWDSRE